jgi:hypothetical protein
MALDFGRYGRSTTQQTLDAERQAGIRDPQGKAAFKKGIGAASTVIPGTGQVKLGMGILGKFAPFAGSVYNKLTKSKVGRVITAPEAELAYLPLGAVAGKEMATQLPGQIERGEYGSALANTGVLALETLLLPSVLKGASKSKLLPGAGTKSGLPMLLDKSGDVVAKVTKPGKNVGKKILGVGGTLVGGQALAMTTDPDPELRDNKIKQDLSQKKTTDTGQDDTLANNAKDITDDKTLDQQLEGNQVNQDLIPEGNIGNVDMTKFKGGMPGDAGPVGTDSRSTDLNLIDDNDVSITNEEKETDDRTAVQNNLNKLLNSNTITTAALRDAMKKIPPSNFHAIKETIDKNYAATEDRISQLKARLDETQVKTFEEFKNDFRQMSGYDGNEKQMDYIMLKLGLDLMSGKSYESGTAGFLDILGRAGGTAVDAATEVLKSEKALNEGLALKFMEYEQDMDRYLLTQDKEIINAQISNLQDKNRATLDAYQKQYDAEFTIDEMYYKALLNKQETETGVNLGLLDKTLNIQIRNPAFYRGVQNFVGKRQKDSGILFIEHKGQYVPFTSLFGTDTAYSEFEIDRKARSKAQTKIDYAYAGIKLTQDFLQLSKNLEQGNKVAIAEGISKGVGLELAIRNIMGLDLNPAAPKQGGSYAENLQNLMGNDFYYGANIEELIAENADPEEKAEIRKEYRKEIEDAREGKVLPAVFSRLYRSLYSGDQRLQNTEQIRAVKEALARYQIIQVKMKYIIANANKAEDRLTQKDIDNAAEVTQISKVFEDPDNIKIKYEQLQLDLNVKFNEAMDVLLENGTGDQVSKFIARYPRARSIIRYQDKLEQLESDKFLQDEGFKLDVLKSVGGLG